MLLYKTEKKTSVISGEGLYTLEYIPKGAVIGLFPFEAGILTEDEYQEEQRKGNKVITMSAVRWIGKFFLTNDEIGNEEYINHSNESNMLYHCGICFAKEIYNQVKSLPLIINIFWQKGMLIALKT